MNVQGGHLGLSRREATHLTVSRLERLLSIADGIRRSLVGDITSCNVETCLADRLSLMPLQLHSFTPLFQRNGPHPGGCTQRPVAR